MDSIINRISLIEKNATKTERKLIGHIRTTAASELIYNSITELAEQTQIGEASILRFCRKLGLKGYQEFKLVMAQDIARKSAGGEEVGFAAEIAKDMIDTINSTLNMVDYSTLDKAAEIIIKAQKAYVLGSGNSYLAARELRNKLLKGGVRVDAENDPHFQAMLAANACQKDALILISVSGSTKDLIEVAKIARKNGAPVVVITNYLKSPISKYADIMLYSVRKEAPLDGGSLITKVSQLFMIDTLCSCVFNKMGKKAVEALEKSAQAVINKIV